MKRRDLFKIGLVTGTTLAVSGCGLPPQAQLVSELEMPEIRLPGKARYFATVCQECAGGCGVSVRVIDNRAKKLEGIPEHPVSHGKVCSLGQSSVQALYNPDRIYSPLKSNSPATWGDALKDLAAQMDAGQGKTLWITRSLRGSSGSVLLGLASKVGAKIWVQNADGGQSERAAFKSVTGQSGLPYYDLANTDFVLNFGGDFLNNGANPVHYMWAYGQMRSANEIRGVMVSVGPHMNATMANSDKWLPCLPGGEAWVALAIGNKLAEATKGSWLPWAKSVTWDVIQQHTGPDITPELIDKIVARLQRAHHPMALAGSALGGYPNGTWQLQVVMALNALLNKGKLLAWEPEALVAVPDFKGSPDVVVTSQQATSDLAAGKYTTIWVLDANPAYASPARLDVAGALHKATNLVVFTPYKNESSEGAQWIIPISTWLEAWGDNRVDGPVGPKSSVAAVYSLQQPVVPPRPGSMSLLDAVLGAAKLSKSAAPKVTTSMDVLKKHVVETDWSQAMARGGVWAAYPLDWEPYVTQAGPLWPPRTVPSVGKAPPAAPSIWDRLKLSAASGPVEAKFDGDGDFVLLPYLSAVFGEGHASNRPWLQELPDPMGMVVWADWIEINTDVCLKMGLQRGDVVRLSSPAGTIEGPAYMTPAIHPGAVAIPLGQGHTAYGRYAGQGMQALSLLVPHWQDGVGELAMFSTRVKMEKANRSVALTSLDRRIGGQDREVFPGMHLKQYRAEKDGGLIDRTEGVTTHRLDPDPNSSDPVHYIPDAHPTPGDPAH